MDCEVNMVFNSFVAVFADGRNVGSVRTLAELEGHSQPPPPYQASHAIGSAPKANQESDAFKQLVKEVMGAPQVSDQPKQ